METWPSFGTPHAEGVGLALSETFEVRGGVGLEHLWAKNWATHPSSQNQSSEAPHFPFKT